MTRLGRRRQAVLAVALVALLAFAVGVYLRSPSSGQAGGPGRAVAAVASVTTSSPEASRYITEYQVGGVDSDPNAIASDSKGNVWFTLAADYAIGELEPGQRDHPRVPHPRPERLPRVLGAGGGQLERPGLVH